MFLSKKLKIAIEIFLNIQGERSLIRIAAFFSFVKRKLAPGYQKKGKWVRLIRFCDFVITRCNGNRFIEFELSNICNAQCVFCPYPDMLRTDKKFMHMPEHVLQDNLRKLSHFKHSLISFTPTTGDTLLHPEWDRYIQAILEEPYIARGTMFTNAIKLDEDNRNRFVQLLEQDKEQKLSEIYFSVGGLDAATYKSLYKVDRFDLVVSNISLFLEILKTKGLSPGIHIHVKMLKDEILDHELASKIFNPIVYPFVYYSQSNLYFSNDAYSRNALISYYQDPFPIKERACAYLQKTRFAADGGIWADGCVISEMPGDTSLKLGTNSDNWIVIEKNRVGLIEAWEKQGEIPLPCKGCTVYRPR